LGNSLLNRLASNFGVKDGGSYSAFIDSSFFLRALTLGQALNSSQQASLSTSYASEVYVHAAISSCALLVRAEPVV
jgi:hypothetical protein